MRWGILACCLLLCGLLGTSTVRAHGTWKEHADDMMEVLGFESDPRLLNWMKFISSDMIDKVSPFYKELCQRHPGFACKHRLLFHWGYDSEPWSAVLEKRVRKYCADYDLNEESNIRIFREEMRAEQKRRNGLMNEKTEQLFGFASGGRDAAFAHFFIAMAYNIHLLGDYTPDNRDMQGVLELDRVVGAIVTQIRRLDAERSKPLIDGLTKINRSFDKKDVQNRAEALMNYLKKEMPAFVRQAQDGAIARRVENKGFKFRNSTSSLYGFLLSIVRFVLKRDEK